MWLDIQSLDVPVDTGNSDIWVLNITEDHASWPAVESVLAAHGEVSTQYFKVFSKQEQDEAEWLKIGASGHHGFPQPEDDYFELTYDSASCRRCGITGAQVNPFRLRSEPKAKHSQFLQLNWVFDELFVRRDAQSGIESAGITGPKFVPAVINKNGEPSREVSQMKVDYILPSSLDVSCLQTVTCMPDNEEPPTPPGLRSVWSDSLPYCHRVKYHLRTRNQFEFERTAFEGTPDFVKSHEWFGSGGQAFRLLIVSRAFRQLVVANKWRGLYFEPIALVDKPRRAGSTGR